jgi:iron complex outermembrane receptor protein
MLFKKHILSILALLSFVQLTAQPCKLFLKGCVTDADNNEHLGFAVVKLLNTTQVIQTNEHGEFLFTGLCAGVFSLQIQHVGCKDTVIEVNLDKSRKFDFRLPHSLNELGEVDVMDKRIEMKRTQTQSALTPEEIEKTRGQSLGDALKNISGVTTLNTGATISKPMLHGMQGYRLLILNNGIRQEGQQWGSEHAPEIDPFIAKRLSVIKGAAAIRYGSDAIAGVVLVEPDDLPDTAAVSGEVNLVGLSNGQTGAASAILQGYFDKVKYLSWRFQGSLKKGGAIKTPGYYLTNTGVEERNYSAAMSYHRKKWGAEVYYSQFNTEIGIFTGSHIGNLSDLENALKTGKPVDSTDVFSYRVGRPYQRVAHELIKGLAHYHFSSKWRARLQYAWQSNSRQEYDLRRLTTEERETGIVAPDLDLKITSQTIDALLEHDNIRSFRGLFGANYMHQENVYTGRFFIPNYYNDTWGAFSTERYVARHAEYEVGLRYDQKYLRSFFYKGKDWTQVDRNFNNLTYNGGVIWKLDTTLHFFVNAGSAWRSPAANELFSNGIHQGVASIEVGNENLKTETCYNVTTSAILKKRKLRGELTLYHNQFSNFIYLNPSGNTELTIRGAFPVFNYTQANVRISGVDVKMEYDLSRWVLVQIRSMFVRAWNYSMNDYLIYMPSDRGDFSLRLKFPETSSLKRSYFQINNTYAAKQWRVPANSDFAPPPNAYYLLGFDLSTEVNVKKQRITICFSATNLLNNRYREYLDRFRYFCDAAGVSYNLRLTVPLILYDKH